jgi:hypothetical protein
LIILSSTRSTASAVWRSSLAIDLHMSWCSKGWKREGVLISLLQQLCQVLLQPPTACMQLQQ